MFPHLLWNSSALYPVCTGSSYPGWPTDWTRNFLSPSSVKICRAAILYKKYYFFYGSIVLVGLGLFYEIPRTYSDTPHSVEISERVISSTQRPLPHNTHKRKASMPLAGSNPQSQQANDGRPTP